MIPPFLRALCLLTVATGCGWLAMDWLLPESPGNPRSNIRAFSGLAPATGLSSNAEVRARVRGLRCPGKGGEEMLAALELARQIAPADFAKYLDERRQLPANGAEEVFVSAVLRRWLVHDPAAAVAWCVFHDSRFQADALTEWTRSDPAAAQANVLAQPTRGRDDGICAVAEALALTDARGALDFLRRAAPEFVFQSAKVFQILAKQDSAWLLEAAATFPDNLRGEAREAVLQNMAAKDFAAAAVWAASQGDWWSLTDTLLSRSIDPAKALAAWPSLPPKIRSELVGSRIAWGETDPENFLKAAKNAASKIPDNELADLVREPVSQILYQGMEKGVADLQRLLPDHPGLWALQVAGHWGWRDASDARAWASQLADDSLRAKALEIIKERDSTDASVRDDDASPAGLLFNADGPQMFRERTAEELMAVLKTNEWNSDVRLIREEYPALYARYLTDPAGPGLKEGYAAAFVSEWAGDEPAAAAAWVASLPDSKEKQTMLREAADTFLSLAPNQFRRWASSLKGTDRDTVMEVIGDADPARKSPQQ